MDEIRFIRLPAVMQLRGRGRASTYTDVRAGLLTEPVELGSGSVGWPEHERRVVRLARRVSAARGRDAAARGLVLGDEVLLSREPPLIETGKRPREGLGSSSRGSGPPMGADRPRAHAARVGHLRTRETV